ncbi:hypothetical protein LZ30DRAFT_136565 [Colletotrichum cereale]|nr:hypothetical protein LZ30DRAFT_136565 [Colletotrichum cereale]
MRPSLRAGLPSLLSPSSSPFETASLPPPALPTLHPSPTTRGGGGASANALRIRGRETIHTTLRTYIGHRYPPVVDTLARAASYPRPITSHHWNPRRMRLHITRLSVAAQPSDPAAMFFWLLPGRGVTSAHDSRLHRHSFPCTFLSPTRSSFPTHDWARASQQTFHACS